MIHEIYFIAAPEVGRFKIGATVDLRTRLQTLRCASPVELKCVAHATTRDGYRLEECCHWAAEHLGYQRLHGEWFAGTPDAQDCAEIVGIARTEKARLRGPRRSSG